MSHTFYIVLSVIGVVLSTIAAIGYFWSIVHGQTRPQRMTWGVWTLAGILGLWAAFDGGAGIGLLVAASTVVLVLITFLISLLPKYGKPGGEPSDKWVGIAAIVALIAWRIIHFSPNIAVTIAIVADASILWLTVREAWRQPETEALWPWVIGAVAELLGIVSLGHFNYSAAAYSVYIFIGNLLIAGALLIRGQHKIMKSVKQKH
jgi:hypothetical protein